MVVRYAELFAGVGGFRDGIRQAESFYYTRGDGCGSDAKSQPPQHGRCAFHCVYASEIDKHASAVYRFAWNGNGELHEGDVCEQKIEEVPDFDFLTAGFPCQSFSVAGRRLGFQDTRGTLFFEVARFLADKRPRHFLLENVKGLLSHDEGKTFQTILGVLADIGYRVEWEVLNSTCWVPQNRERVFFVGHLRGECGRTVFPLREDDEVYPESFEQVPVAKTLQVAGHSGGLHSNMTVLQEDSDKGQRTMVATQDRHDLRVHETDGEVPVLKRRMGEGGNNAPMVGKLPGGGFSDNRICGDVAPTLMGCAEGADGHQSGISHRNPIVVQRRGGWGASVTYNVSGTLPGQRGTGGVDRVPLIGNQRFRRLTPLECERLQGWPDEHTALGLYRSSDVSKARRNGSEYVLQPVSDTQRYRMTGNGVTADCVREIVKKMILVGCFG